MKCVLIPFVFVTLFGCNKEKGVCIECDGPNGTGIVEICYTYEEAMTSLEHCDLTGSTICWCEKLREEYQ